MTAKMNRGDIYWVDLSPTKGSEIKKLRPCVITSATPINKARRTVIVVPLSTKAKVVPPITVAVNCLNTQVTAVCDQIRTVDKSRLQSSAGKLTIKDLKTIENSLKKILVLDS